MSDSENKKFLIIDSRPFGLFSIFLHTVDNIYWAEQNGYIPVVRWGPGRWNPNCGRMGTEGLTEDGPHPGQPKGELVESTNFSIPNDPRQKLFETEHPPNFKENGNMYGIKNCLYLDTEGDNPWEYFFEPLNKYTVDDALSNEHLISDIFQYGGNEQDQQILVNVTDGQRPYPDIRNMFIIDSLKHYGRLSMRDMVRMSINFSDEKEQKIRSLQYKYHVSRVNKIIKKITIKKSTMNKINDFEKNNFNNTGKMLGVHIRGTDKCGERGESQNFGLRYYIKVIEQFLDSERTKFDLKYQKMTQIERDILTNKEGINFLYWKGKTNSRRVATQSKYYYKHAPKIFVATDSEQVVEVLNSVFPGMIITYPSRRMPKYNNNTPIHLSKQSGQAHGEEALIETVLLSRCDTLIGSDSNMSIAAAYMNTETEFILIDTLDRRATKPAVGCTILL